MHSCNVFNQYFAHFLFQIGSETYFYETTRNQWRQGTSIPGGKRDRHACTTIRQGNGEPEKVLVVGGFGRKSTQIYDVRTQTWSNGPDVPDSNSSPYIYNGRLVNAQSGSKYAAYLIGGKNGYSYQTKVYGISKNLQTWEDVGITLRPRNEYVALSVPSTLANHKNCIGQGNEKEPFYLEIYNQMPYL